MDTPQIKPNSHRILCRLKDFQNKTVQYVYRRLYEDEDRVDRFLIADEVGLGKTFVARGVLALAVDRLWNQPDPIDILYICANRDIAQQNLNRLNITDQKNLELVSRLTLLPLHTTQMQKRKINLVSFTPGTSFDLKSREGLADERVLIYYILRREWGFGEKAGYKNLFQCNVGKDNWRNMLESFKEKDFDRHLGDRYLDLLKRREIHLQVENLADRFSHYRKYISEDDKQSRLKLIGELRALLAECCVKALEPDVVILDEFQRFKYLLDEEDEVSQLAQAVFNYPQVKIILLSATPYKMYTMFHEREEEDHYADFFRTVRFLFNSHIRTEAFETDLEKFRKVLLEKDRSLSPEVLTLKKSLEDKLRKVMVRTERLSASARHGNMIQEVFYPSASLRPEDIRAYSELDELAEELKEREPLEYWKSAPFFLNTMERDHYKIKRRLTECCLTNEKPDLVESIRKSRFGLLHQETVNQYHEINPLNSRLRMLQEWKVSSGSWMLLWMPPAFPYYRSPGSSPYADPNLASITKSLIFSSWQFVPKTIAMLSSYEAERQMVQAWDRQARYTTERTKRRPLLNFTVSESRLTGMSVFAMIYPCLTLARLIDPLEIAAHLTGSDGELPTQEAVLEAITRRVENLLFPIIGIHLKKTGPPDQRWYWAAMALLDKKNFFEDFSKWLNAPNGNLSWSSLIKGKEDHDSRFTEHVNSFKEYFTGGMELGRPPEDLSQVLAKITMASPAVTSLRSFLRLGTTGSEGLMEPNILFSAAKVAIGFRSLFNSPETISLIRSLNPGEDTRYWETALDYCTSGNLQSVMDEYVHILRESLGLADTTGDKLVGGVADEIFNAVSIRTVALKWDEFNVGEDSKEIEIKQHSLRCRYALRFGDGTGEEEGQETRKDQIRTSFNSPFRPFILGTTSIGQEGLDFHQYCHEIYHWNLPSNPVDLEQREGRIHRYKGHVIRKNLALDYPLHKFKNQIESLSDPWEIIFNQAKTDRGSEENELVPYWLYNVKNGYKITRHLPALPFSKEKTQYEYLCQALVLYRLVMGQPRQEDLLDFLNKNINNSEELKSLNYYRIDLSPQ